MKHELQNQLLNDFPDLYSSKSLTWGFECGDGWYELIRELSEKLQEYIKKYDLEDIYPIQVKEKFGTLRFYMSFEEKKVQELISEYEDKTFTICEICGKKGSLSNGFWMRVRCENHAG